MNAEEEEQELDYYKIFGLPSGRIGAKLPQNEIKDAHASKCFQLQARRYFGEPNTDKKARQVEDAYEILGDDKLRSEYDYLLRVKFEKEKLRQKQTKRTQDSGSRSGKGFEEKLSIAMENMSKRKKTDSSSDFDDLFRAKWELWFGGGHRVYLLFEFAYGYALVFAPDIISEVGVGNFESAEKYITPTINHPQPLKLKALHLFSSSDDALVEMNAISESTVTEQLKSFLLENISRAIDGNSKDRIATSSSRLADNITRATNIPVGSGIRFYNVMRALRKNIDKFIQLHPGDLENAQANLACLYSKQKCTATYVENSMVVPYSLKVAVVPHKFEGIFVAKLKKKDIICTKNLVYGEALHSENLICVENENGTEVEYRVWDPRNSKLAAAITCGVTDMWIKPGSRVLYLGDVCGITVFQLSDLVGSDGLVYVVGMCDDIVNMANKRSNVVRIFGNPHLHSTYRMVVGTVDVIFADMASSHEVNDVVLNAGFYLKTGGHYMIATQDSNTNINVHDLFAHHHERREFKQIELIRLEPTHGAYVMVVGVFRQLEDV